MPEIRRATGDDIQALVALRLALCQELEGITDETELRMLEDATHSYLEAKLASGEFIAWLAVADRAIVSMSGLLFFQRPPTAGNLTGLEAYIMNMYTIPEWRRQGLASMLLHELIAFVQNTHARRIWLHASAAGMPVYAALGFKQKTSMMDLVW